MPLFLIPLLTAALGFVVGVVVNLLADYLPARRYHIEASRNPFGSRAAVPAAPSFLPRRADGQVYPVWLWSGVIARLTGQNTFADRHATRHVLVEVLMVLFYAEIGWQFASTYSLLALLYYAAALTLIVLIDIESRWVMLETIIPTALIALVEAVLAPRVPLEQAVKGGVYGLGVMLALYLLGLVFGRTLTIVTGRRVGRTVFGMGDVYIGALGGLILGWTYLWMALLLMIASGAIAAILFIVNKTIRRKRYRMYSAIPYGPYIVFGIAVMLYEPQFIRALVHVIFGWPMD